MAWILRNEEGVKDGPHALIMISKVGGYEFHWTFTERKTGDREVHVVVVINDDWDGQDQFQFQTHFKMAGRHSSIYVR